MTYQNKLNRVRELNASSFIGSTFQHYKRRTYYRLTGFSTMKDSEYRNFDEKVVVHYVDMNNNPHTRLYNDFFGTVEEGGEVIFKFAPVPRDSF